MASNDEIKRDVFILELFHQRLKAQNELRHDGDHAVRKALGYAVAGYEALIEGYSSHDDTIVMSATEAAAIHRVAVVVRPWIEE